MDARHKVGLIAGLSFVGGMGIAIAARQPDSGIGDLMGQMLITGISTIAAVMMLIAGFALVAWLLPKIGTFLKWTLLIILGICIPPLGVIMLIYYFFFRNVPPLSDTIANGVERGIRNSKDKEPPTT